MPRRREVPKRKILADPKYNDISVTKFMSVVMQDGKKAVAEQIVYGAFVAGLRAGWGYNTFPMMGDRWIPEVLTKLDPWWANLVENTATVQFVHRWIGTALLALVVWFWLRVRAGRYSLVQRQSAATLMLLTLTQYLLGVYTLLKVVPLVPAVMHQGCASLVLLGYAWVVYAFRTDTRAGGVQAR